MYGQHYESQRPYFSHQAFGYSFSRYAIIFQIAKTEIYLNEIGPKFTAIYADDECQCSLSANKIVSCQKDVISNFPADLLNSCPQLIEQLDQVEGKLMFTALS